MLRLLILETDVTDKLVNIFKAKRTNHVTLVCVFILHLKEKIIRCWRKHWEWNAFVTSRKEQLFEPKKRGNPKNIVFFVVNLTHWNATILFGNLKTLNCRTVVRYCHEICPIFYPIFLQNCKFKGTSKMQSFQKRKKSPPFSKLKNQFSINAHLPHILHRGGSICVQMYPTTSTIISM